jgi:hypothetical protein
MLKIDGIMELLYDARKSRSSFASYTRVNRACRAIGLTNGETERVLSWLDYHGEGQPCLWLQNIIDAKEQKKGVPHVKN